MYLRGLAIGAAMMACGALRLHAQNDTLRVVNWNLEWFADGSTHDPTVQTEGVRQLMQTIDADIYALCEVVNIDSLESVVSSLPDSFGWYVSSFTSFAASPADPDYADAQKLGFVYRKSRVRNISHGPLLEGSVGNAYFWFSSGRYPWRVSCEVKSVEGNWTPAVFIVLHAKAYADDQSCYRRTMGADELRDTLNTYFANVPFVLLGDFNDDLDTTNCAGSGPSNYASMVEDTTHFRCLTLPISMAGAYSSEGYTSLIDHAVASNEMAAWYVPNSARTLKSLVLNYDPFYSYNISDHYPVETKYVISSSAPTSVAHIPRFATALMAWPQPADDVLMVEVPVGAAFSLVDMAGRERAQGIGAATRTAIDTRLLEAGVYVLKVNRAGIVAQRRIVVRHD